MVGELVYVPCRLKRDGDKQIMVVENAAGELIPVPRAGVEVVQAIFCMVAVHVADVPPDMRRVTLLDCGLTVVVRPVPDVDQWKPAEHYTRKSLSLPSWATAA